MLCGLLSCHTAGIACICCLFVSAVLTVIAQWFVCNAWSYLAVSPSIYPPDRHSNASSSPVSCLSACTSDKLSLHCFAFPCFLKAFPYPGFLCFIVLFLLQLSFLWLNSSSAVSAVLIVEFIFDFFSGCYSIYKTGLPYFLCSVDSTSQQGFGSWM